MHRSSAKAWLAARRSRRLVQELFDADWYRRYFARATLPEGDLLDHYMTVGWKQGLDPNCWFSAAAYSENNRLALADDTNPFVHFVLHGSSMGLTPGQHSQGAARTSKSAAHAEAADVRSAAERLVDSVFYFAQYPDVLVSGMAAPDHYMANGWREGREPNAWFSTPTVVNQLLAWRCREGNPLLELLRLALAEPDGEHGFGTLKASPKGR